MTKIGILNGPNLNRLGLREPKVYGSETLNDLKKLLVDESHRLGVELDFFQSNHEGELVDRIHQWADEGYTGVVANPAAYTHTSVALRDAVSGTNLKVVEVHISNVHKREEFRHHSYLSPVCEAVIAGMGFHGYLSALNYLADKCSE